MVRRALAVFATACALVGLDAQGNDQTGHVRSPVTVADLVRQTLIGDPMSLTENDGDTRVSTISPDGRYAAIILRNGDPNRGTNDAALLLYETDELTRRPEPRILARYASLTNYQPLALLRWSADSESLTYAASEADVPSQVFRLDLRTGRTEQLTSLAESLRWYDVTPSGDWLVTLNEVNRSAIDSRSSCVSGGCRVTAESVPEVLGRNSPPAAVTVHDVRKTTARTVAPVESTDPALRNCLDELTGGISPNGRFGLRLCELHRPAWPEWWVQYQVDPVLTDALASGMSDYLRQWVLYDFKSGVATRLTSAPYNMTQYGRAVPLWIDGGSRVILAGMFEPLLDVDQRERSLRATRYAVISVDPESSKVQRIAQLDPQVARVTGISWHQESQTLAIRSADASKHPVPIVAYRRANGRWNTIGVDSDMVREPPAVRTRTELSVRQSLNGPPKLVARDAVTGTVHVVAEPNSWLQERTLARVEPVSWKARDGREWRGGIYHPPMQTPPRDGYPVVLQTHGFEENTFSMTGVARNFTAQVLASAGILVLQIDDNVGNLVGPAEWETVQMGYESAIDYLGRRNLIDRDRVGIHGWSRTGPYAGYTLTHSSYKFAAGVFTMTADFGWWYYLLHGAQHGENAYGPPPFGDGLMVWKTMSPSFNLDRVRTPMLMCETHALGLWDWFVGLRRLQRPVEYWVLQDATHDVFQVSQRMLMNQMVVDWFRFWLKGEEAPGKEAQYQRWRALRRQHSELDFAHENRAQSTTSGQ